METKRLLINKTKITDKEDYFKNISHDKKVLETFICTYVESIDDFDFSKYINRDDIFAIRLKDTGKLIGIITKFDNKDDSIEIGYGIGSEYWNNGYVTEAVECYIDKVFKNNEYNTIYASFFTNNLASKRVMEKLGMKYSHTNLEELEYLGVKRDLIYYKISKNEWLNINK
ncbi:MAG: GNAT family N-acetyltransferase [Bacilli bacterium]|nr:GNAT family N-acetyltransferase [Bacilli bacterium]